MSRVVTPENKLIVVFVKNDIYGECSAYTDAVIESVCKEYLDNLAKGKADYFYISQELVLTVMRSLLYKEYKHLQSEVWFFIKDSESEESRPIEVNDRMRLSEYPDSVWTNALVILIGATDESRIEDRF